MPKSQGQMVVELDPARGLPKIIDLPPGSQVRWRIRIGEIVHVVVRMKGTARTTTGVWYLKWHNESTNEVTLYEIIALNATSCASPTEHLTHLASLPVNELRLRTINLDKSLRTAGEQLSRKTSQMKVFGPSDYAEISWLMERIQLTLRCIVDTDNALRSAMGR